MQSIIYFFPPLHSGKATRKMLPKAGMSRAKNSGKMMDDKEQLNRWVVSSESMGIIGVKTCLSAKKKWCWYIHERIKEAQGQNCASIVHLDLLIICNNRHSFGLKIFHGKLTIKVLEKYFSTIGIHQKKEECRKFRKYQTENPGKDEWLKIESNHF